MGSSYNNFLANIEVDEKEIKRDMAKREIAKRNRQRYNEQQPKVRPKVKPQENINTGRTKNQTASRNDRPVSLKQGKDNVRRSNESLRQLNNQGKKTQSANNNSPMRSNKARIDQENYYKIKQEQNNRNSQPRSSQQNKVDRNQALTRDRLKNEHIHLRQKKMGNTKGGTDAKRNDQVHLTMSKKEYDQKVLGTIRENSTKFILFKDSTRLAKAPKGVVFLGFYVFIMSAIMLYYFSQVAIIKMELSSVNEEYSKLNEVNAQLNIKLATAYNIDNIRQRAENELYMSKPEPHQIMYISVVPENFVEYEMGSGDNTNNKKNNK